MCRIPHTRRRQGRYVFRRRVHFRNLISKPVAIALQTADPKVARQRAALLSAPFVIVKASVDKMLQCGRDLTGAEIEALFREELERELSGHIQEHSGMPSGRLRLSRSPLSTQSLQPSARARQARQ
jgi:hypothetical protein